MSADPLSTPSLRPPGSLANIAVWLVMGTVGTALLFAAAVHLPQEWKRLVLFPVALGALGGWGLGKWALVRLLRGSLLVLGLTWVLIVAGEGLAAVQTYRAGITPERPSLNPDQLDRDLVTEGMRQYFASEPEGLSEEGRERWLKERDEFLRGEERLRSEREARRVHRSFYGYLANRIPREWGKWRSPWPAVFWVAEILLASAVGTWLAFLTLRAGAPPSVTGVSTPVPSKIVSP